MSARAAEYVRLGLVPRLLAAKPPLPSFSNTRLKSGQCRPLPRTMSGRPSPLRSPTFTPAEVSPFSSKSNTRSKVRKTSPAWGGASPCAVSLRSGTAAATARELPRNFLRLEVSIGILLLSFLCCSCLSCPVESVLVGQRDQLAAQKVRARSIGGHPVAVQQKVVDLIGENQLLKIHMLPTQEPTSDPPKPWFRWKWSRSISQRPRRGGEYRTDRKIPRTNFLKCSGPEVPEFRDSD